MSAAGLCFVVHNHQPVGNFDDVVARAARDCYAPLVAALERHPKVKAALHYSGPLLAWLEARAPELVAQVRALAQRGQVELLGGALMEPILPLLPDTDAWGQLTRMAERVEALFGDRPAGMWLPERVWEPDLPRLAAPAGYRYTFLDDAHFRRAGMTGALHGHYVTDYAGAPLALFPIEKELRYAIPYTPVAELMERLAARAGEVVTYGDDGEKLGLWRGTREQVWEKGWLEELFAALEATDEVETLLPREVMLRERPRGRAYPPSGSYEEMDAWSGGHFSQMLARYGEANRLHKRMLHVSQKLAEAAEQGADELRLAPAREKLYRGQCNCAYWHGLFGGLYLPHLRDGVFTQLIAAENAIDAAVQGEGDFISYEEKDLDADLAGEALLANAHLWAAVKPSAGGALWELDLRAFGFHATNVLTRREERYHAKVRELAARDGAGGEDGAPRSLHELERVKEAGLAERLVDDGYERWSFLDRFHAPGFSLPLLVRGGDGDHGDFARRAFSLVEGGVDEAGDFSASVRVRAEGRALGEPLRLEKVYRLPIDAPTLTVRYAFQSGAQARVEATHACELNFTLLAGSAPDRYLLVRGERRPLDARQEVDGPFDGFTLVDEARGFSLRVNGARPFSLWLYPIETVSSSDEGFERVHQGVCLLLRTPLSLGPGELVELEFAVTAEPFSR